MPSLSRTGVAIDQDLLDSFDRLIEKRGYKNRSEALRDLIRDSLIADAVDNNKEMAATLTIVYDHHVPILSEKLIEMQHHAGGQVLTSTHVHLDDHCCLEVILMKGNARDLQQVADSILSLRGVKNGKLVLTSSGD